MGFLIFGGRDPESGCILENMSNEGFIVEHCKHAWPKVGTAPLTMACIHDPKVWYNYGDNKDGGKIDNMMDHCAMYK